MRAKIKRNTLGREIDRNLVEFLEEIQSLRNSLPLILFTLSDYEKFIRKKYKAQFIKFGQKDKKGDLYISQPYVQDVRKLEKKINDTHKALHLTPESFLVTLISLFDAYLGSFLNILIKNKPELLNTSEMMLPLKDLARFSNIKDVLSYKISEEIDNTMRGSHSDHIEWIEKKFNIEFRKSFNNWNQFIEITERRNLFVHCDGRVSEQYLAVCKKNNYSLPADIELNQKLDVSSSYFIDAYNCIYRVSTELTQLIWRKLFPEQIMDADHNLNEHICVSLLENSEFELAIELLEFATKLNEHHDDLMRRVFIINKALAYKLDEKKDISKQILKAEDWTAVNDELQLVLKVIEDHYDEAAKIMLKMGQNGNVKKTEYLEWPVFREFIKAPIFLQTYKTVFEESFNLKEEEMASE